MRRLLAVTAATVALLAAAPFGSALADPGAPGATFPEQPDSATTLNTACAAVGGNTGTGVANASVTAQAILDGIYQDACLGG
jgi:hypothetical protein